MKIRTYVLLAFIASSLHAQTVTLSVSGETIVFNSFRFLDTVSGAPVILDTARIGYLDFRVLTANNVIDTINSFAIAGMVENQITATLSSQSRSYSNRIPFASDSAYTGELFSANDSIFVQINISQ